MMNNLTDRSSCIFAIIANETIAKQIQSQAAHISSNIKPLTNYFLVLATAMLREAYIKNLQLSRLWPARLQVTKTLYSFYDPGII